MFRRGDAMWKRAAFALAAILASGARAHDEAHAGRVALADWPYCNTLVLAVEDAFSIAEWQDGLWLFAEGDPMVGALDRPGERIVWIENAMGAGEMTIAIEQTSLGWPDAQIVFHDRCAIRGLRHSADMGSRQAS
jgi:hypothetical protein